MEECNIQANTYGVTTETSIEILSEPKCMENINSGLPESGFAFGRMKPFLKT
jgi:hypothetical protein